MTEDVEIKTLSFLFEELYRENGVSENIEDRILFLNKQIWGEESEPLAQFHSTDILGDGCVPERNPLTLEAKIASLQTTYAASVGWIVLDIL